MHKNLLWQAFMVIVFCVCLGYSGVTLYRYYSYSHLQAKTPTISTEWHIQEKADDVFLVSAEYGFQVGKTVYKGIYEWNKEPYLNRYAAEDGIKTMSSQPWQVWYDPANPAHSSLAKHFPLKEVISTIFLWALFLYFLWLGFYVAKFKNGN